MNVKNFYAQDVEDLGNQLKQISFKPTIAFVFSDVKHDIAQIQNAFGDIDIFGATSAGEILDDKIQEGGISVMVTDLPKDFYKLVILDKDGKEWEELGNELGKTAKESFNKPGIILSAPGFSDGDFILKGIFQHLEPFSKVIGGFAGDDLSFAKAKNYTNDKVISEGLIAVIVDTEKILIDGRAVNGWGVLGESYTITQSDDNIVYQLNGRPALDVLADVYGIDREKLPELMANFGPKYPVLLYRYDRPGVLRHPIKANLEDGSVIFSARMPLLANIEFGVKPNKDIMDLTIKMISELKDKISDPDFMIMFSCKARHLAFGQDLEYEISNIHANWDKPMIGFFTYGEIGIGNDGRTDFHNETCNLLLVKEL